MVVSFFGSFLKIPLNGLLPSLMFFVVFVFVSFFGSLSAHVPTRKTNEYPTRLGFCACRWLLAPARVSWKMTGCGITWRGGQGRVHGKWLEADLG